MKILLTMAGLGSRFKTAGYEQEKFEIEFRGHTLLEWSLASLLSFREFPLVLITRDFPGIRDTLPRIAKNLGFNNCEVIVIDRLTRGQAETAILAEPLFADDDSIFIFNTDTFIDPKQMGPEDIRGSGWIPTFHASGEKWSFVEADETGQIHRTTEKQRISDDCSVGVYYFDSFFAFKELVQSAETESELYVAPLYNQWMAKGNDVFVHRLSSESVTVLGTPEDLEAALNLNKPVWPEDCISVKWVDLAPAKGNLDRLRHQKWVGKSSLSLEMPFSGHAERKTP